MNLSYDELEKKWQDTCDALHTAFERMWAGCLKWAEDPSELNSDRLRHYILVYRDVNRNEEEVRRWMEEAYEREYPEVDEED